MMQKHVVLDYASPPKSDLRWTRRAAITAIYSITVLIACTTLGAFIGHMIVRPLYYSRGVLWMQLGPSGNNSAISSPTTQQLQSIVTTALVAARRNPAGKGLPSSSSEALNDAAITIRRSDGIINISFKASDASAAACMANEMLKACISAPTINFSGIQNSPLIYPATAQSVTVLETAAAGLPVRNPGVPPGGFAGAAAGVVLLVGWFCVRYSFAKKTA